jgi:hypothetical protein
LNSNAVVGTGTAFIANSRVGDAFLGPDGGWYEITNIASNTALSITPNYRGATNAAGVYALTPVQGYTKDLADQARAMIQQWGATLAALGSVSTENIVPVAKGGTGGSTQGAARNGLGLGSAAVAAIVGTVSQSGGTPTGAIIESGFNSNGHYLKLADGHMICRHVLRMEQVLTADILGGTWVFPAQFANNTVMISHSLLQGASGDTGPALNDRFGPMLTPPSTSGVSVRTIRRSGAAAFVSGNFMDAHLTAVGRWFV